MKAKYSIVFVIIVGLVLVAASVYFLTGKNLTDEELAYQYLEDKYNEEFVGLEYIKTIQHKDFDFALDGSTFFTIKGKGEVKFYTAHSIKSNLEFSVSYDSKEKAFGDNYESRLNLRNNVLSLYDEIQTFYDTKDNKIIFAPNIHDEHRNDIILEKREDLEAVLINIPEGYPDTHLGDTSTLLYQYIDTSSLEFCKVDYKKLVEIKEYLLNLQYESELYSRIDYKIQTSDNISIVFHNEDILIYDKFETGRVWGETIEEFIKRDKY